MFFRSFAILAVFSFYVFGEELNIYIDADFTSYKQSSHSIEMGIKTAINNSGKLLGKTRVNVIKLDHRANSLRSLKNIKTFLADPKRLAIYSGIHSPPLLANNKFINDNKALFMIPWAAASPITRPESGENWIFRLSVDDSKAGSFLVNEMSKNGFSKPFLLLEKTGWGKSNSKNINEALDKKGFEAIGTEFFNWGPTDSNVSIKIRKILKSEADCILFVGNAGEGEIFAKAMNKLGVTIPVISHWGIIGGGFYKNVGKPILDKQKWNFLQTKFSFTAKNLNKFQKSVLTSAQKLFPDEIKNEHIKSPTGFIHAYDLTKILITAWSQSGKSHPVNFENLKNKLENLEVEVEGLIKNYRKPFSKYSKDNEDAHEALGAEDLRLAEFDERGNVILK